MSFRWASFSQRNCVHCQQFLVCTGSLLLEVGENGDASVGKDATDNSLFNINTRAETIYVFVTEPAGKPDLMP